MNRKDRVCEISQRSEQGEGRHGQARVLGLAQSVGEVDETQHCEDAEKEEEEEVQGKFLKTK